MVPPKTRGLRPLSEERYNLFVQLLKGTYHVPVKERTSEQRRGILQFWRVKNKLSLGKEENKDVLLHEGKRVLTVSNLKETILQAAKKTLGAGARSIHYKMKGKVTGGSEARVRKILSRSQSHSIINARFTNQAPIQSMQSKKVFERLQIDLIDMRKEPVVHDGIEYSYILSAMDCFSRFVFLRPLSNKSPRNVLKCLKNIFSEHGYPSIVQCDNGTEFKGDLPAFLAKHSIKLINSSPYHPQSQGKVERNNSLLKRKLNFLKVANNRGSNWAKCLFEVACAINSQPKEVLGYQTPFMVYYGRGDGSTDDIRKKASLASARCGARMKRIKSNFCCSIYKSGEKVLLKYPCRRRVPKKRSVVIARILKRNKFFSKYFVTYLDPNGVSRKEWVSVENITSLTVEEEKKRREKSKKFFQEKRRRENHRRKYYIAITPSTETQRNSDHDKEKGQSEPEIPHLLRNCVEDNANDAIFIPGVRITLNPTSYGNCQFDALACQLNSLGLFRTGDQLRHSAILHLRENRNLYVDFFRNDNYFDLYLNHMSDSTTYGDHFTLQAIARIFCLQILVISKLGQGHHRIVSDTGRFDPDLPIITVGHYPEGLGEHYVSVVCANLENVLPKIQESLISETDSVNQSQSFQPENEVSSPTNQANDNLEVSSDSPATDTDMRQSETAGSICTDDILPDPLLEPDQSISEETERPPCPEKKSFGENNSSLHTESSNTENPLLPNLVLENIIRICIEFYPESMFRLQYVNRFFMHVVRSAGLPLIHINNLIMPDIPNPVCIRRLVSRFGRNSGLICRLREIVQDQRFLNTWLVLFEEENNWYEIRNIFWRKRH